MTCNSWLAKLAGRAAAESRGSTIDGGWGDKRRGGVQGGGGRSRRVQAAAAAAAEHWGGGLTGFCGEGVRYLSNRKAVIQNNK